MTLLTTEIHNHNDPERALIVFAADRRISRSNREYDEREKILRVLELNAGIGYFGLAEVPQRGRRTPMAEWLRSFLAGASDCENLKELAAKLADSLNLAVPASLRRRVVSGFHIAGFDSHGSLLNFPDFKQLAAPEDYVAWVKFKMELIAQFYEQFCTRSIIGRPVDAFAITRRRG